MAKELLDILVVFAVFGGLALFVWLLAWQQDWATARGWRRVLRDWPSGFDPWPEMWRDLRRWWGRLHKK